MKCTILGCPGNYEDRRILHTVHHRGQVVVIDKVPAEVCDVCGDVLLKPETVTHLNNFSKPFKCPHEPRPFMNTLERRAAVTT